MTLVVKSTNGVSTEPRVNGTFSEIMPDTADVVTGKTLVSTKVTLNDTFFSVMAELCYLKVSLCKTNWARRPIILDYAYKVMLLNDESDYKTGRRYLEAEMKKRSLSKRTILRILPEELKDYTKRANRLGKTKLRKQSAGRASANQQPSFGGAASCYLEPD